MSNYGQMQRGPYMLGGGPTPAPQRGTPSDLGSGNLYSSGMRYDVNGKPLGWDTTTPAYQAYELGRQEQGILGRQAPQMGAVSAAGLDQARGNQLAGISAQQAIQAGPSLAGARANQQFGGAQQQAMGAGARGGALGMRAAMLGGGAQLGSMAQQGGNAVGQEQMQGQQNIAGAINTLGQGDVASQQGLEQAQEKQRQMNLSQRGQNLGYAQGLEQNYFNTQNAYTQQAKAQYAAYLQKKQGLDQATANLIASGAQATGAVVGGAV